MESLPPYVYISIVTSIITIAGAWAVVKYRIDKSEDVDKDLWKIITKIRDWQSSHERDSLNIRIDYEKRIGDINSNIREMKSQHSDIMRRMDSIDVKLDKLFDLLGKIK